MGENSGSYEQVKVVQREKKGRSDNRVSEKSVYFLEEATSPATERRQRTRQPAEKKIFSRWLRRLGRRSSAERAETRGENALIIFRKG